jgi:hypothetical protein
MKEVSELVGLFRPDLVISGVGIEEGHGFASHSGINDLVNMRQRVGNFEHALFKLV